MHDANRGVIRFTLRVTSTWKSRLSFIVIAFVVVTIFGIVTDVILSTLYVHQGQYHVVTSDDTAVATPAPSLAELTPTQMFLAKTLRSIVRDQFQVSPDPDVTADRLAAAYRYLSGTALTHYQQYLAANENARNPYVLGQTERVVLTVVRVSPNANPATFDVVWSETAKEVHSGAVISRSLCAATFTFSRFTHSPAPATTPTPLPGGSGDSGIASMDLDAALDNIDNLAIVTMEPSTSPGVATDDCGLIA
jgi:type IV secretory pathway TrbF-like protein